MAGNDDDEEPTAFSVEVGRRLRQVRKARRMSLDEVEASSNGRWSASAIGAYERGFRNLSLPRLRDLAEFYSVPMAVLLGEPEKADTPGSASSPKVKLDLEKLASIDEASTIMRYIRTIIIERGDFNGRVLSVRHDDLRALCAMTHMTEDELFSQLSQWGALLAGGPAS